MKQEKTKGYILILLSVVIYGLYGILTRFTADTFGAFTLQYHREGLTALIIIALTIFGISKWVRIQKNDIPVLLLVGTASTIGNLSMYYAYSLLDIGLAAFVVFASTIIFSSIIGILFLKEKISKFNIFAVIFAIIGLLIMFEIQSEKINAFGLLASISFGVMIALYGLFTKKVRGEYGPLQIYLVSSILSAVVSFIFATLIQEPRPIAEFTQGWFWMIVFALSAVFANGLYILGIRKGVELSIVGILMPLEAVIAAISGVIILGEGITERTIIGGIMIIIASVLPHAPELFNKKN